MTDRYSSKVKGFFLVVGMAVAGCHGGGGGTETGGNGGSGPLGGSGGASTTGCEAHTDCSGSRYCGTDHVCHTCDYNACMRFCCLASDCSTEAGGFTAISGCEADCLDAPSWDCPRSSSYTQGNCISGCTKDANGRCTVGSCNTSPTCAQDIDCPSQYSCASGVCRTSCTQDADCSSQAKCIGGICTPLPAAPSSFNLTSTACNQMQLTWKDNSNGGANFKLERASYGGSSCGSFVGLTTLPAGTTSYTDTDSTFIAGTTYCYRICASSSVGDSSWVSTYEHTFKCSSSSSCAASENCYNGCCLPLAQTPPVAPSSLNLASTACNQMQLTWKDNSNNETSFKLERADYVGGSCGSYAALTSLPAGTTSYIDTNSTFIAGTTYCYHICASNSVGDSSWVSTSGYTFKCSSSSSCAADENCYNGCCLPLAQTPPVAPSSLNLASTTCNQIQLTWKDNSNNETSFKLERADYVGGSCGSYAALTSLPAGTTSYTDTDATFTAGTTYCYRICASNSVGDSSWVSTSGYTFKCSSSSSCAADENCYNGCCLPLAQTLPVAPSSLNVASTACNQMQLTWKDNSNNETSFKLERADYVGGSCGSYAALISLPAGTTSYTDTDATFTAGTTYCYRICASNSVGDSSWVSTSGYTFKCHSSSDCAAGKTCTNGCCQ